MKNSGLLSRKRVMDTLDQLADYPLTILSATMGYGKTTAMRDYLQQHDFQNIWLPLIGCDGDETVFWDKLSKAFGKVNQEIGKRLERIGFPIDARQNAAVIDLMWKFSKGKETIFVIDDYHLIDHSASLGTLIELLAEEEIPHLHIVLLTRTRPTFNLINLIAKGLCCYLTTELLAFTLEEIREYFDIMGISICQQEAENIYRYTEGWISAVYLLLLGAQKGLPMTGVSNITQLVNDNLFCVLEESVQQLLIDLSVIDQFTLAQAVEVSQNGKAPQIIKQLMAQNAFMDFDQKTGIYKLHNVFLDFLRDKVITENIDLSAVCQRAGKWFLDQGKTISAFEYYYRAKQLGALLEQINQLEFVGSWYVGVDLLRKIYQEIPPDWYIKYPFPMLHFARCFIISGDKTAALESAKIITVMENHFAQDSELSQNQRNQILGEIEIIKIFLAFNDAEKMVKLSQNAKKLLGDAMSVIVLPENEFSFGMPHFLYTYYRESGKLRETLDCIQAGFPPTVFGGCGTGCELVALAEYALETGDLLSAERFANKAIYKAKTMKQTGIILCADFTILRLRLLEGKIFDAKALILEMRNFLLDLREKINLLNTVIYNSTIDLCEGFLYGCLNAPDLMPEWLRTGDFKSRVLMLHGLGFPNLIYEKAVLLTANWIELEVLCEGFIKNDLPFHNQLGLIYNAIYDATAKRNLYGMKAGIEALIPALCEAQVDGILLPFAENAAFTLPILYELQKSDRLDKAYLERLIQLCERYQKNLQSEQSPAFRLTARECEVLRLLAQGLTQREMADRLYLSVSGVKKHLENIYAKLGVNNKIRAVQRAKEENLL